MNRCFIVLMLLLLSFTTILADDQPSGDLQKFRSYHYITSPIYKGEQVLSATYLLHYDHAPYKLNVNGQDIDVIDQMIYNDLFICFNTRFGLSAGLDLPFATLTTHDAENKEDSGFFIGDLHLRINYIFPFKKDLFDLGITLGLGFPTGDKEHYVGFGGVSTEISLFGQIHLIPLLTLKGSFGYMIQPDTTLYTKTVGDELFYNVGATFTIIPEFIDTTGMLMGRLNTEDMGSSAIPLEWINTVGVTLSDFKIEGGYGIGLGGGIGTPSFRVLLGLSYHYNFDKKREQKKLKKP